MVMLVICHHAHYYVIVMSSRNEWRMQRRRTWNIILPPTPPPFQHFSLIFDNVNDKVTQCFSLENKCKKIKKLWKEKNCHI